MRYAGDLTRSRREKPALIAGKPRLSQLLFGEVISKLEGMLERSERPNLEQGETATRLPFPRVLIKVRGCN